MSSFDLHLSLYYNLVGFSETQELPQNREKIYFNRERKALKKLAVFVGIRARDLCNTDAAL